MDIVEAMELDMAARYLQPLMPVNVWQALMPRLAEARATLNLMSKAPLSRSKSRVAFIDDGQPLLAPDVAPDVLAVTHESLLHNRRFAVAYRAMDAGEARAATSSIRLRSSMWARSAIWSPRCGLHRYSPPGPAPDERA